MSHELTDWLSDLKNKPGAFPQVIAPSHSIKKS